MLTLKVPPASKFINGEKWIYLKRGSGRSILCKEEAYKLFEAIKTTSRVDFHSLYLHKQVMGISSSGGGLKHLMNRFSAHSHKLKLEGGEIEYNMIDGEVLLSQLTIDWDYIKKKQKDMGMGLYKVRNSELEGFSAKPVKKITTAHVAVNGTASDIEETAQFMPEFINYGYPKTRLNSKSEHTLFYNDYNGFLNADWKCMLDSSGLSGGTPAAKKLAAVIEIAAREKRSVNWTIHERGCAIFKQALRLVNTSSQYDYSNQTVFYANPLVNAELIDKHRERLGMALSEKAILTNGFSFHQGLVAGNWASEPRLIWKAGNKGLASVKAGVRVAKIAAVVNPIVTTAIVLPALTGAAPWAMALLTLLGTNLFAQYSNRGIISNMGDALNHYLFENKSLKRD